MPRHEPVSPEEDLAAFYGGAAPGLPARPDPAAPAAPAPPKRFLEPTRSAIPPELVEVLGPDVETGPRPLAPVSRRPPNFTEPPQLPAAPTPNVWLAALLSFLLPGAGQIYAGQVTKGGVILLIGLFTCFGGGALNLVAAIDAFLVAQRKEQGETVAEWKFF